MDAHAHHHVVHVVVVPDQLPPEVAVALRHPPRQLGEEALHVHLALCVGEGRSGAVYLMDEHASVGGDELKLQPLLQHLVPVEDRPVAFVVLSRALVPLLRQPQLLLNHRRSPWNPHGQHCPTPTLYGCWAGLSTEFCAEFWKWRFPNHLGITNLWHEQMSVASSDSSP